MGMAGMYSFLCLGFLATTGHGSMRDAVKKEGPEHQLFERLFHNYSSESRPVANASHPVTVQFAVSLNQLLDLLRVLTCDQRQSPCVTVQFAVSLNQLLDLDEKNQVLTTSVWIYEDWRDENLIWRPRQYNGQKVLMIPAEYVWLPDIFIFNIAGESIDGFINVTGSKVAIQHNGHVRWMVPLIVNSACAVDVTYFPYDQQICEVKFSSWIYDLAQLDLRLTLQRPDLEHYVMNSEYDLVNVSLTREVLDGSCCPGDGLHAMVNLKIHLRRKSLYYDYIVIAPTIMLCVLTLASFLLPCHKGEKIAIGLTVFLTLYVLQLRIADNVPDTNSTPILGVFLFVVMTFNCISLIMATIVMNIKKRGDEKHCPDVPKWMLWICHKVLSRVVCTRYLWKDEIPMPSCPTVQQFHNDGNDQQQQHQCVDSIYRNLVHGKKTDTATDNAVADSSRPQIPTPATSTATRLLRQRKGTDPSTQLHGNPTMATTAAATTPMMTAAMGSQKYGPRSSEERMFHMKRQWFFVAEVTDKFAFLIYLLTMSFTIFMILYVIPVYMRQDPVMT